jgi:hypothetical protein
VRAVRVVLSLLALLVVAPPALAGTTVERTFVAELGEDKLAITGDDGPNDVRIDYSDASDSWEVTIGGGIDSAVGCDVVSPTRLRCPYTRLVDAAGTSSTGNEGMGAGDDSFRIGYGSDDVGEVVPGLRWLIVDLGPGDDFFGGSEADDEALGQEGDDVIEGAEGDDWLGGGEELPLDHPASPSQGSDEVFGGPGSDVIYDGDLTSKTGPDVLDGGANSGDLDWVYYYFRTASLTLNLANEGASQGESGEGDIVRNAEGAWTGEGADTVAGNATVNKVVTEGGDDTIDVSGDPGNVDVVHCGAGLDTVTFDATDSIFYGSFTCGLPPPPTPPPFVPRPVTPAQPSPVPPTGALALTGEALIASVAQELAQARRAMRRCGTTGLLRKAGCRDSFTALRRGTVAYRVTTAAGTLIARGRKSIPAAGSYTVKVKATKKGRQRLRRARKLRATLTVSFTEPRGNLIKRSMPVVLMRRP